MTSYFPSGCEARTIYLGNKNLKSRMFFGGTRISSFKLEGLTSPPFTPMTQNGDVDYDRIDYYSKHLSDNGIHQVFVNGSTGEAMNLTLEERKKVVEKWMDVGKKTGRMKAVVVHVGALHVDDAKDLARHAASVGADAIATVPPLYYKPNSLDMLITCCQQIASAAPNLPFYYYHVPSMTGVNFSIEDFLKQAPEKIPSLVGVKFSSGDMVDLIGAVNVKADHRDDGRFNILFGTDQALIAGMCSGTDGGIGSTYNFMPGIIKRLMNSIEKGDLKEARKEQYRVQQACVIMYKYGKLLGHNVASLKCFMTVVGVDLGPVRSPLRWLTEEEMMQFKEDLKDIGFFDWYQ